VLYCKFGIVTAGLGVHTRSLNAPKEIACNLTVTELPLYSYRAHGSAYLAVPVGICALCIFIRFCVPIFFSIHFALWTPLGLHNGCITAAQIRSEKLCSHTCMQLVCNVLLIKADISVCMNIAQDMIHQPVNWDKSCQKYAT